MTSNMALKQGQKTRLNGDKPHTVLKMGYSKCQQGQGLLLNIRNHHIFEIQTRDVQTAHYKEGFIVVAKA